MNKDNEMLTEAYTQVMEGKMFEIDPTGKTAGVSVEHPEDITPHDRAMDIHAKIALKREVINKINSGIYSKDDFQKILRFMSTLKTTSVT